ncbi:GroES-like protein [Cubamyces sp. BRFM 1775]|nr:GroES-like protein [Cubamyces sp. BRFM 1775]
MTISTTQKALLLHAQSTPYVLGESPVCRPGPEEVLVKIMACALNPIDHAIVDPPYTQLFVNHWPFIAGYDGSGIVIEVGSQVNNLKEGDKVLFLGDGTNAQRSSTFQQYAVVPAELTAIIPDNITFEQAATLPLALTTDVLVLYNQSLTAENISLRLKPVWEPEGVTAYAGTPAFIIGGASSLGQYAIQLAKLAGHNPIVTTASPHNAPLLISLGATQVIDRHKSNESVLAELSTIAGGKAVEFAFVAIPHDPEMCRLGRDALAPGGALAVVLPSSRAIPEDVANPGDGKRLGFVYGSPYLPYTREAGVAMYKQITGWLQKGILKPNPVEVLPNGLAGIPEGLERMKANKISGKKLVALPQETP